VLPNTPLILGEDTNFQDGAIGHIDPGVPLTVGAPARMERQVTDEEQQLLRASAAHYAQRCAAELRKV
jgi:carbonic anhydrase/acetyltransferase-like protein (isoleucine patch superfamily)